MAVCSFCGDSKDGVLLRECTRCGLFQCPKHIVPESHECLGIEKYKEKNQERWINALKGTKFSKKDIKEDD